MTSVVTVNDVVAGNVHGAARVAVALLAVRIAEESDGAIVAGAPRVAFFAHALTRLHIARLLRGAHLVAFAVLAAFEELPAPGVWVAKMTLGAVAQRRTDATTRLLVADFGGAVADVAF